MVIKLIILDGESVIYDMKKAIKVFKKEYSKFLKKFSVKFQTQEKLWLKLYPKIVRGKITSRKANEIVYRKIGNSKIKSWGMA